MMFISINMILISIFMVLLDFFLETGEDPPPGEACEVGAAALYPSAWNAIEWWVISLCTGKTIMTCMLLSFFDVFFLNIFFFKVFDAFLGLAFLGWWMVNSCSMLLVNDDFS